VDLDVADRARRRIDRHDEEVAIDAVPLHRQGAAAARDVRRDPRVLVLEVRVEVAVERQLDVALDEPSHQAPRVLGAAKRAVAATERIERWHVGQEHVGLIPGLGEPAVEPVLDDRIDAGVARIDERERGTLEAEVKARAAVAVEEPRRRRPQLVVAERRVERDRERLELAVEQVVLGELATLGQIADPGDEPQLGHGGDRPEHVVDDRQRGLDVGHRGELVRLDAIGVGRRDAQHGRTGAQREREARHRRGPAGRAGVDDAALGEHRVHQRVARDDRPRPRGGGIERDRQLQIRRLRPHLDLAVAERADRREPAGGLHRDPAQARGADLELGQRALLARAAIPGEANDAIAPLRGRCDRVVGLAGYRGTGALAGCRMGGCSWRIAVCITALLGCITGLRGSATRAW